MIRYKDKDGKWAWKDEVKVIRTNEKPIKTEEEVVVVAKKKKK